MRRRLRLTLAFLVLLVACGGDDAQPVGDGWYVRSVPADVARHTPAKLQLLREKRGERYIVSDGIGSNYRFYPRDCLGFEAAQSEALRNVFFVCGDHTPVRVATLSTRGVVFDDDGIRPAPGVELHPGPGIVSPAGDTEPTSLIALQDMKDATLREPMSRIDTAPAMRRANYTLAFVLAVLVVATFTTMRAARRWINE